MRCFLWYAQREQTATASSAFSQDQVTRLRLLHELSGGEVVRPLQLECYQVGVFATENEAGQAAQLLAPIAMAVAQFSAPEEVAGYQLAVEIPSQAQAQRELLDRLAIAGGYRKPVRGASCWGRSPVIVPVQKQRLSSVR